MCVDNTPSSSYRWTYISFLRRLVFHQAQSSVRLPTAMDRLGGHPQKRAFHAHFHFNVVLFGLTNAPASFSNMMLRVLHPVLNKWAVVHLDRLLIYSISKEEYLKHVRSVLGILRRHGFAKLSKCSVQKEQTETCHIQERDPYERVPPTKRLN